jgi:hypothetical protein
MNARRSPRSAALRAPTWFPLCVLPEMVRWPTWTEWTVLGNDPLRWGLAALVFLLSALTARTALRISLHRMESPAQRTHNGIDDLVAQTLQQTKTPFLLLLAFWLGSQVLALPASVDQGIDASS